jgi:hypothetical protein
LLFHQKAATRLLLLFEPSYLALYDLLEQADAGRTVKLTLAAIIRRLLLGFLH